MTSTRYGLGWQRDLPDYRDYTAESEKIKEILDQSKPLERARQERIVTNAWTYEIGARRSKTRRAWALHRSCRHRHGGILPETHSKANTWTPRACSSTR